MKGFPFFILFVVGILISCKYSYHEEGKDLKKEISEIKPSSSYNHIKHIRENSRKGKIDNETLKPEYFVDYVIEKVLKNPDDKKYITDRSLLRKLKNDVCWDNYVLISDTLLNGDKCEIKIKTQTFKPEKHVLTYEKESNFLKVDGKYPFGAVYSKYPKRELGLLEIKINNRRLDTKIEAYQNIYEPEFCNSGGHRRITEAYEDGENIYIYLFGGNAAGSYFAKLIFDRTGFVTSIIVDYVPLSMYGSFGEHFIGF